MAHESVRLAAGLPKLPQSLLLARDQGKVLFIVGAGASYPAPSSLPDFAGLVTDIYSRIDKPMADAIALMRTTGGPTWEQVPTTLDDHQRTELKFMSQNEYDVVLGMLERRMDGDSTATSTVRVAAAEILNAATAPNPLHSALVRLGQRFGRTLLATTNFDRLLTIAARNGKYSAISYALGNMPSPSRRADFHGILHIHGMLALGREQASALVLTDQDFGDYYLRKHILTSFLYDAARIFNLVLVGYSANDSPVRYLLNAIAADERNFDDMKMRYAFIGHDPSDTRTPTEWSSRGIAPISYDNSNGHAPLGDILTEWANIIPEKRNAAHISQAFADVTSHDPKSPSGTDALGLFKYIVKRSTSIEIADLAKTLASSGTHGKWLSVLTDVVREGVREQ